MEEITEITKEANESTYSMPRKKKILIASIVLVIILTLCYFANNYIVISKYTYKSEKIGKALDGFKIVQISDLHNASFGSGNERLIRHIKSCKPDIIVITGDMVDVNHTDIAVAISFAKKIVKICPVYYVTGNHEIWLSEAKLDKLKDGLKSAGVTILENDCVTVERGEASFYLVGLRDTSLDGMALKNILKDKEGFSLVLAHEPQYLDNYAEAGADLVLSGHAHGGQIRLPFIGGLYAPDQGVFPKYTAGKYTKDNTQMIVSRGLGNSVIPLRVFNHPEVVCVELKSE